MITELEIPRSTITELLPNGITRTRDVIDIPPGRAKLMHLGYSNVLCDDDRIAGIENQLASIADSMVQCTQRASPPNLDNCTAIAQIAVDPKGDDDSLKRIRVCIGFHEDGTPIITQKSGRTEIEAVDNAIRAILHSERRYEFVQDTPQSIPSPIDIPTLREYADM